MFLFQCGGTILKVALGEMPLSVSVSWYCFQVLSLVSWYCFQVLSLVFWNCFQEVPLSVGTNFKYCP